MKIVHYLLLALLGIGEAAAQERWTIVAQTDKAVVQVDTRSITVKDGFRRAWVRWDYAEDRPPPPLTGVRVPFRSARYLTAYDCKAKSSAELQAVFYDAGGEVAGKVVTEPKNAGFVVPGLLAESALDFVCSAKLRGK